MGFLQVLDLVRGARLTICFRASNFCVVVRFGAHKIHRLASTLALDAAAKTCGLEIIHTPYEAPRANAICERFVGSVRRECLDHMLVFGSRQLVRVLVEYAGYFNPSRPHQALAQQTPDSRPSGQATVATGKGIARPTSPNAPVQLSSRKLMAVPVLNDLHHSYAWVT